MSQAFKFGQFLGTKYVMVEDNNSKTGYMSTIVSLVSLAKIKSSIAKNY